MSLFALAASGDCRLPKHLARGDELAVEMEPLSLLCRLTTSGPPPRLHTVPYTGVLAAGSQWRSRTTPVPPEAPEAKDEPEGRGA